jgi:hypothetical protein
MLSVEAQQVSPEVIELGGLPTVIALIVRHY